jgi:hypothetical protein
MDNKTQCCTFFSVPHITGYFHPTNNYFKSHIRSRVTNEISAVSASHKTTTYKPRTEELFSNVQQQKPSIRRHSAGTTSYCVNMASNGEKVQHRLGYGLDDHGSILVRDMDHVHQFQTCSGANEASHAIGIGDKMA